MSATLISYRLFFHQNQRAIVKQWCCCRWRWSWCRRRERSACAEILLLLALGLACTALAHTLSIASLSVVTAHTASVVAALEPVYGIALATLLLGETLSARTIAGGLLLVAAAILATRRAANAAGGMG